MWTKSTILALSAHLLIGLWAYPCQLPHAPAVDFASYTTCSLQGVAASAPAPTRLFMLLVPSAAFLPSLPSVMPAVRLPLITSGSCCSQPFTVVSAIPCVFPACLCHLPWRWCHLQPAGVRLPITLLGQRIQASASHLRLCILLRLPPCGPFGLCIVVACPFGPHALHALCWGAHRVCHGITPACARYSKVSAEVV